MSSSAYGSLGSPDFVPQSTLGPSRRTRSRQKTLGNLIEKEREKGKASFLLSFIFHTSLLLLLQFFFTKLMSDYLQSKRKSDPKKGRSQSSGDDVVQPSFTHASFYIFPSLFWYCVFVMFCDLPPHPFL